MADLTRAMERHRTTLGILQMALSSSTLAAQRADIVRLIGDLTQNLDELEGAAAGDSTFACAVRPFVSGLARRWRAMELSMDADPADLSGAVRNLRLWARRKFPAAQQGA